MVLYIAITIALLLFSFWELFCNPPKIRRRYLLYILSFVLWCISFLRWDVGTDWDSYLAVYEECNNISWYEPGFLFLNRLVRNTVDSYTVLLAILGGILFYFQTKAIKSLSLYPVTTLLVLLGTNLCNVFFVRQLVAVAIMLYAVTQIERRKLKNFILLVGVATLIHAASIAFLPAYWIYHRRFTVKQIIIALSASVAIGSVGGALIWGGIGDLLGGIFATKIDIYLAEGADASFNSGMSAAVYNIRSIGGKLLQVGLFAVLIGPLYRERTRGMMNLFLFATVMLPLTVSVSVSFGRMWVPYFQLSIFLMTYAVASQRRFSNRMLLFIVLFVITIARLYLKLFVDYDGEAYLPFQTVFSLIL